MKLAPIILAIACVPVFAQAPPNSQPPPAAHAPHAQSPANLPPDPNFVPLKDSDKLEIVTMQRDVEDAVLQAYQLKAKLDDQNKAVQDKAAELNAKLDALRKQYNLPSNAIFNQQKVGFLKAPDEKK